MRVPLGHAETLGLGTILEESSNPPPTLGLLFYSPRPPSVTERTAEPGPESPQA